MFVLWDFASNRIDILPFNAFVVKKWPVKLEPKVVVIAAAAAVAVISVAATVAAIVLLHCCLGSWKSICSVKECTSAFSLENFLE